MKSFLFRQAKDLPIVQTPHYKVSFGEEVNRMDIIHQKKCKEFFEKEFFSSTIMYGFMDIVQWILFRSYSKKKEMMNIPMVQTDIYHPLFEISPLLKKYGEKSTSGLIRWTEMLKDRFPLILKSTQKKGSLLQMEDLLHEYIVSLYAINSLRNWIPHFSFSYALYCEPNYSFSLVLEWIHGITLSSYLDKMLPLRWKEEYSYEWIHIFMQIIFALEVAQEQNWFTHYDLHADNIILRENQNVQYIPKFPIFNERYQFSFFPKYIPTLIDFAHASVTLKHTHELIGKRGKSSFPEYGMYASYLPGADMLKLILYIYNRYLSETTWDPSSVGERLFRPFIMWILRQFYQINLEDKKMKQNFLKKIRESIYNMTQTSMIYLSPFDFIQFIEQNSNTVLRILRIKEFPWKSMIFKHRQNVPTKNIDKYNACFQSIFCSSLEPIVSSCVEKEVEPITKDDIDELEQMVRQKKDIQYPTPHDSHLNEMIQIVEDPQQKRFRLLSDRILLNLERHPESDIVRKWFHSPWKRAWIYHYRIHQSLLQFVIVMKTTLKLP